MTDANAMAFMKEWGVSRETSNRIAAYVAMLLKWNRRINLISKRSAQDIWTRHIRDSAQLLAYAPAEATRWLDMGSGGGLPGLVVGIMAEELRPALRVILMESDERKCVFLESVVRTLGLSCDVVNARIEAAPPANSDVISARALAPLSQLLEYADFHRAPATVCLFLKGRGFAEELTQTQMIWHLDVWAIQSATDPESVLLRIGDFSRV